LSSLAAKGEQKTSFGEVSEGLSGEVHVTVELRNLYERPGSSASSTSDAGVATSGPRFPAVLPSSSVGLLSSEKSTLNPNAKVSCYFCIFICFHLCLSRAPYQCMWLSLV